MAHRRQAALCGERAAFTWREQGNVPEQAIVGVGIALGKLCEALAPANHGFAMPADDRSLALERGKDAAFGGTYGRQSERGTGEALA